MTYETDLARMAERVAQMIADRLWPSPADLPIVDVARLAVRRWCRQVLDDVAPADRRAAGPIDRETAASVASLRELLIHDPHPFGDGTSDEVPFDGPTTSAGGETWRLLRIDAVVIAHGWSSAEPGSRPAGEAVRSAIADIAAIVEAGAVLDRLLATAYPGAAAVEFSAGRRRDGLEVADAAAGLRRLVTRDPLPVQEPLRSARGPLPIRVRSVSETAPALARLGELVAAATHLRPETVAALAGAHWRTLLTVSDVVEKFVDGPRMGLEPGLAAELRDVAGTLRRLQPAARQVASIELDDPRPVRQMRQVRDLLRGYERSGGITTPDSVRPVLATVRPALACVSVLRDAVERHIDAGEWYERTPMGPDPWRPTSPHSRIAFRDTARRAGEWADRVLAQRRPRTRAATPKVQSPHAVLHPRLIDHDQRAATGNPGAIR